MVQTEMKEPIKVILMEVVKSLLGTPELPSKNKYTREKFSLPG
jgi:hypothetical protein